MCSHEIQLRKQHGIQVFTASNSSGQSVQLTTGSAGGVVEGFRPMELLLAALGACAAFDFTLILEKQKQPCSDIGIRVTGDRVPKGNSTPFAAITVCFELRGDVEMLKQPQLIRAARLSVEKYCSVGASLSADIPINIKIQVNGKTISECPAMRGVTT